MGGGDSEVRDQLVLCSSQLAAAAFTYRAILAVPFGVQLCHRICNSLDAKAGWSVSSRDQPLSILIMRGRALWTHWVTVLPTSSSI